MFAGVWGAGPTSPHPPKVGVRILPASGAKETSNINVIHRGPGWLSDLPNVTQLKSNKTPLAGTHSTGNPPHTHRSPCPLPESLPSLFSPRDPLQTHPWGLMSGESFRELTGPRHLTPHEIIQKGPSQALAEKELHQLGGEVLAAVPRGQLQHSQGTGVILLGKNRRQVTGKVAQGPETPRSRRAQ